MDNNLTQTTLVYYQKNPKTIYSWDSEYNFLFKGEFPFFENSFQKLFNLNKFEIWKSGIIERINGEIVPFDVKNFQGIPNLKDSDVFDLHFHSEEKPEPIFLYVKVYNKAYSNKNIDEFYLSNIILRGVENNISYYNPNNVVAVAIYDDNKKQIIDTNTKEIIYRFVGNDTPPMELLLFLCFMHKHYNKEV